MRGVTKQLHAGLGACVASARAVGGANLTVRRGELVGLRGEDQLGRSVLLQLAAGLLLPDEGEISWFGNVAGRCGGERSHLYPCAVAYVAERAPSYPFLSVRDVVQSATQGGGDGQLRRVEHVLSLLGLERRADDAVSRLSPDALRRLALARALAGRPRLLLVDEWRCDATHPARCLGCLALRSAAQDGAAVLVSLRDDARLHVRPHREVVMRCGTIVGELADDVSVGPKAMAVSTGTSDFREDARSASLVAERGGASVDPMFRAP
jgi:predicted ABC-type transport system involved in lysophospholipase L1 biosynthesis ATPase subunit